jgi:hypothetical protein
MELSAIGGIENRLPVAVRFLPMMDGSTAIPQVVFPAIGKFCQSSDGVMETNCYNN